MAILQRRYAPRYNFSLSATMEVYLTQGAENPFRVEVELSDLNERGCVIRFDVDDESHGSVLRQRTCCGYLEFRDQPELPEKVFAKTVWAERDSSRRQAHNIGLYFEDCPESDAQSIRSFVEARAQAAA